jgi:hypothetical protein
LIVNGAPTELLQSYATYAENAYKRIKDKFKGGDLKKTVELIPETRLLCNLKSPIEVNGVAKEYVQSKLDIVVLVDGVPNIVDLKVSLSGFENTYGNPKSQKIYHTMAAYQIMAKKSGLIDGGGSFIEDVTITENGELKSDGALFEITGKVNRVAVKQCFKDLFDLIETTKLNIDLEELKTQMNTLVTTSHVGGRRKLNVETLSKKLIARKQKDGTYTIHYTLFNDNMSKIKHSKDKIPASDLDKVKHEIAEEIARNASALSSMRFNSFKTNLKTFVNGRSTTNIFIDDTAMEGSAAFYTALMSKYKSDCRVLEIPELDAMKIILIETPVGIDVINFTEFEVETPWDPSLKDAGLFDDVNHPYEIKKTVGSVQYLNTLLLVNNILPNLDLEVCKLNSVQIIGTSGGGINSITYPKKHTREMLEIATSKLKITNNLKNAMTDPVVDVL